MLYVPLTQSIHNFISCGMVSKLGCIMEIVPKLKVLAANGEELKCCEMCGRFSWSM